MNMNMNSLVTCFGTSLRGFFEFCEEQNGVKADDLNNLFEQYFSINGSEGTAEATKAKPAKKAPAKKATKKTARLLSDSDSDDDSDTSVSSKEAPKAPAKKAPAKKATKKTARVLSDSDSDEDTFVSSKKEAPKAPAKKTAKKAPKIKPTARKPSGKGKDAKPRDEQTPVADLDLHKKKLPELKNYARERGLPVSGTKAQLIENLLNYEEEQEGAEAKFDYEEEDLNIHIKKPKTKGKKMCEPADKPKYKVENMHGVDMIYSSKLDGWLILDNDVVVGWTSADDEANAKKDEEVNIYALNKDMCEAATELGLAFEVPDNLD